MVRLRGLEPPRVAPQPPQGCASTSSAITAREWWFICFWERRQVLNRSGRARPFLGVSSAAGVCTVRYQLVRLDYTVNERSVSLALFCVDGVPSVRVLLEHLENLRTRH